MKEREESLVVYLANGATLYFEQVTNVLVSEYGALQFMYVGKQSGKLRDASFNLDVIAGYAVSVDPEEVLTK